MNATKKIVSPDYEDQIVAGLALGSEARAKSFAVAGDNVELLVSCNAAHKGYLSGYFSIVHDLNPRYLSAVVATRDSFALVVSASDAGPALEEIGDPSRIFRYGYFCFENAEGAAAEGYDVAGYGSFEEALIAAVKHYSNSTAMIGIDRTGGDQAWTAITGALGTRCFTDISGTLAAARRIKLPGEIARIASSTKLVEAGILKIADQFELGMTELDLAGMVAAEMVGGGAIPRFISVTSGPRSALADAYSKPRVVRPGDLIRIDAGCIYQGYASDMARTLVVGEPNADQARSYAAIHAGIEYQLSVIRSGMTANDLFNETVEVVRQNGIPSYRRQHVGHGIGLGGGYDAPIINAQTSDLLEAGMSLCVETPYYKIGWGGMMIEDTIVVTETGYDPITTIPRDLHCIG